MTYFIRLAYSGRDFHGYQAQKGLRTVQGVLNEAAKLLFGCDCLITGCSRTDAGVHARDFCATLTPLSASAPTIPADKLPIAMCNLLPSDVAVFEASEAPKGFHPRYDALGKEYVYRINNSRLRNPFDTYFSYHRVIPIDDIGYELMCRAAEKIKGKRDYSAFMAAGSNITECVRNIYYVKLSRDKNNYEIRVAADGFLYNMVRIIVGTLLDCADRKISPEDIDRIIESKDRTKAGQTAPPQGLCLEKVFYGKLPFDI
jgi:tRNA pseudouridine38-40 synthase